MLKINKLLIDSFRAFENEVSLDFTKEGLPANLVMIYAPNGTGKTSIIDAIEWACSGKINRIDQSKVLGTLEKKEKKYILKNEYSDKHNASVNIILSNDKIIESKTKKLTGNRKTDYDSGIKKDQPDIGFRELGLFVNTNVLTHDHIDRFLRFKTSRERYSAFEPFWDYDDLTNKYDNLVSIKKEVNKQLKELEKDISNLKNEIKKIQFDEEIIDKIKNKGLELYNKEISHYFLELKNENLEEFYYSLNIYKGEYEKRVVQKQETIDQLSKQQKVLEEEYPLLLSDLHKNRITYDELIVQKKIKESADEISKIIKEQTTELEKLNGINFKISRVLRKKNEIENNLLIIEQLKNEASAAQLQTIDLSKRLETIKKEINNQSSQLENLDMKIASSTNKILNFKLLESYSNKCTDFERKNKEKNECQISLSKLKIEVEKIISNKDKLNDFFSKLNKGLNLRTSDWPISEYSVLEKSLERLLELNGQIGHIIDKNEEIDKQIDNFKILGNKLKQLSLLGLEVIIEKNTDICPLCHKKHESFNNLIGNIETDLSLSDNETILLSVKRDNLKRIDIYRNNLTELNLKVIEECKKIVTEEVNNINGLEIQIKKLEDKIIHLEIDIDMLNKEIINMNQICDLENLNIEAGDLFKQIKEKTEKHNIEKDISISEKIDILVVLEKNNLKIGETQNRILELQNKVITIEKKAENLINSDFMKQYNNLLRELDLSSFEEIEEVKSEIYLTIKGRGNSINEKEKEVEHLINQIDNASNEELVLKISLFEKDINTLSREIETTEQTFLKLLEGEKISAENFNKKKNIYLEELEQLNHDLILISGLTEISSNFINGTMYFEKKKILEQKLIRENATTLLLTSVEDERGNCLYSIELEIKERLNLEFINKIFSMIEPHPEYKSILFKLTEEKEQLGLNILCEDSQDNIDPPILYLSSAQVNVLSLSVFLATAVYGDSKIDTVVMDDPIQHLDNLNELSFIDILRVISNSLNKQIIITTHDETFFNLCRRKINSEFNSSKFIDLPKLLK